MLIRRAIALIGICSARCNRRISAQSSTLITLQSDSGGVRFRPSPRGQFSRVVDTGQMVSGMKVARARLGRWHGTWEPVAPAVPVGCWTGRPKGAPQAAETVRGGVPVRGTGADRLVVARKRRNGRGAKGPGCLGRLGGQPA